MVESVDVSYPKDRDSSHIDVPNCFWCDLIGKCSTCEGDGEYEVLKGSIWGSRCGTCEGSGVCVACDGDGIIMEEIVRAKFTQNEDMKWRLLATGDAYLKEGNTWHDTCWGVDAKTGEGQKHLGKILMKVRDELKEQ